MADLEKGETLHSQFQAMNRLAMRETVNGQARPSSWYYIYPDNGLDAELAAAMPGVTFKTWETTVVEKRGPTKTEEVRAAIVGYVQGLPLEALGVSLREVSKAVGSPTRRVFQSARGLAEIDLAPAWVLQGQSFVRV
jgi:hypothetical protein